MNMDLEEDANEYRQRLHALALAKAGRVNHALTDGFTHGRGDVRDATKKLQKAINRLVETARTATLSENPNRLELRADEYRKADRWQEPKALKLLLEEAEIERLSR